MTRKITIHIYNNETTGDPIDEEKYADLANMVWMVMRTTPFNFDIEPDQDADTEKMDDAWAQYGDDASWDD